VSIKKISHIGIAVQDLEEQVAFYRDVLGLELESREVVPDQNVEVAMFKVGESTIELLSPTSPESAVARFLDKRGQGIHHLAYEVDDIQQMLQKLEQKDVKLLDRQPRAGAHGKRIAFLHPAATFGVLTELCE
jgi:methylmalonyl-CoA/ethylmalonyl-CoA epimerase